MIDEFGNVVCERCHRIILLGQYPFCPHGDGHTAIGRDEIPGGVVVENYGPTPIRFDSHSERRAYMKAHGLQEKDKFCPTPGTDIDPAGIPNPAGYLDPQTLLNAAELIGRNGRGVATEWDGEKAGVLVKFGGEMTGEEANNIVNNAGR